MQNETYYHLFSAVSETLRNIGKEEPGYTLVKSAIDLTQADEGTYVISGPREGQFQISVHLHTGKESNRVEQASQPFSPNQTFLEALQNNRIIRLSREKQQAKTVTGRFTSSVMYVPVKSENIDSVIVLYKLTPGLEFTEFDEEIAYQFCDTLKYTLENLYLVRQLREAQNESQTLIGRLRASQQIAAALHAKSDKREALEAVLDTIIDFLGFHYAAISMIQDGSISTEFGRTSHPEKISLEWMGRSRYPLDHDDIIAYVARTGEMKVIEGWHERLNKEIYLKFGHENLVRVYLPIPDQNNGQLGVIEAGYDRSLTKKISRSRLNDLKQFVMQVAVAIDNLNSHEKLSNRTNHLFQLTRIAREMASRMMKPHDVLQIIANSTRELINADMVVVLPFSSISGNFVSELITVSPDTATIDYLKSDPSKPSPYGLTHNVFIEGIYEVKDIDDLSYPRFVRDAEFVKQMNIKSYYGIRIAYGDENVGVLYINFRSKRSLSDNQKDILDSICDLAAGFMHNVLLLNKEQKHSQDLQRLDNLINLAGTLTNATNLDETLDYIITNTSKIIPNDECCIWLLNDSSQFLYPVKIIGKYKDEVSQIQLELGEGIIGHVAATGEQYVRQDVENDETAKHIPGTPQVEKQSLIAVPIKLQDTTLGVMSISRYELGKFDLERDPSLLSLISNKIAAIVHIINLLEELQQKEKILSRQKFLLEQDFRETWTERNERYAGRLFYETIGHEVRNVLNIIGVALKGIESRDSLIRKLSNTDRRYLRDISERVSRSSQAIVYLLKLARESSPDRETVAIGNIVERAIRLMAPRFEEHDIQVEFDRNRKLPDVKVSTFQLIEVLLNLFSNATKAMIGKSVRQLTISSHFSDAGMIEVAVQDTGIGITRESRDRIFELYYTNWPTRGELSGSGIGLVVSRQIVREHGGELLLANTTFDKGSIFLLRLPPAPNEV
jgi:signal transduction histidine kinase